MPRSVRAVEDPSAQAGTSGSTGGSSDSAGQAPTAGSAVVPKGCCIFAPAGGQSSMGGMAATQARPRAAPAAQAPAARAALVAAEELMQHSSRMSRVEEQFEDQRASNASGLPHFETFRGHRAALTRLLCAAAQGEAERLCVLGAGNAYDLELSELLGRFAEVHLVDIDSAAVRRARERVPEAVRPRLLTHAPLDLSGMFQDIERWGRMQVTPQELMAAPAAGAKLIATALPGPFDVVASTCLLTQLQLTLLQLLGDSHQLFAALREFLTLTHLRTLAALTKPGGRALLITDLCASAVFPPGRPRDDADLLPLMGELVEKGQVIHSSHPQLIALTLDDDPVLKRCFDTAQLSPPWLWQNGPSRQFLVYAFTLPRK